VRAEKTRERSGAGPRAGAALAAVGIGLVVAALVALILGLFGGGDDLRARIGAAARRTVVVTDRRLGVSLRVPSSWRRLPSSRAVRVQSADRRIGLSVSSVASRPRALAMAGTIGRSVAGSLREGKVIERGRVRFGGRPAVLMAVTGRNARGESLQVLAMSVESRWRTYAVATFGSRRTSQPVLRQAQSVIASLTFTRPQGDAGQARRHG